MTRPIIVHCQTSCHNDNDNSDAYVFLLLRITAAMIGAPIIDIVVVVKLIMPVMSVR